MLSGTPITCSSHELAIITNICKSDLDGRKALSCSIFDTVKGSLDHLEDQYITNRLYGIIAYSDGIKSDYPELLELKEIYCKLNENE
jgi:hypothetical protein